MCLGANCWRVHVRDAIVELIQRPESQTHVPRVKRRRQPVFHVVVDRERLVSGVDTNHRKYGPKDLFLFQPHPRFHTTEDRRLEVKTLVELLGGRPSPAAQQVCSLRLPNIDVTLDLRATALIYQWTDIGALFPPVAELESAGAIDQLTQELIVNAALEN